MNITYSFKGLSAPLKEYDLAVRHHFSDHVYAKQMRLKKGEVATTHAHKYDHLSILASGSAKLNIDGLGSFITGPAAIHIPAGKHHMIEAITDLCWFCIHATDETDIEKIDKILIEEN